MMTFLAIASFLGIIYGVAGYTLTKVNPKGIALPHRSMVLAVSVCVFALSCLINSMLYKITAQEVAVVIAPTGVRKTPITTGWNFVAPWSSVKRMDKTVWVYTLTSKTTEGAKKEDDAIWAPTSDGIKMGFDLSVNWRIDANEAAWIYSNIVSDQAIDGRYKWIEENIIRAAVKSVMAQTVSKFTPIECYSDKRQIIQDEVLADLRKELKTNRLVVEAVQIREVHYSPQYETSINEKKLAEQKVLTLVQVTRQQDELLKQAVINKNIAIEKAEGEAKSLKIKGEAINQNPKIVQLEWIAAWKEGGSQVPQVISGGNGGQMFMMNLNEKEKASK